MACDRLADQHALELDSPASAPIKAALAARNCQWVLVVGVCDPQRPKGLIGHILVEVVAVRTAQLLNSGLLGREA